MSSQRTRWRVLRSDIFSNVPVTSVLDASQVEGPKLFVYYSGRIPQWVCATGSVRLEDSRQEVNLLTKTPGGRSCTY